MTSEEIEEILKDEGLHEETVERLVKSYEKMRLYYGMKKYEDVGSPVGNFCENAANLVLDILGENVKPSQSLGNLLAEIERNDNDSSVEKTVRITIPRFLRATYDMRSNRDTVHVNLEVPVNHADQKAAINMCTWILAELVRAYGDKNMEETAKLIENLASDVSPHIDEFRGRKLITSGELETSEEILIHMYNAPGAVLVEDLAKWVPDADKNLIQTNLRNMEDRREVFYETDSGKITSLGAEKAEELIEDRLEE